MTSARHERASELFLRARELAAGERGAFLEGACGSDRELFDEVTSLLASDGGGSFLDTPALGSGFALEEPEAWDDGDAELPDRPDRIGEYRVTGLLGRGGMGIVYLAEQEQPRREVALKVLRPGLTGQRMRRRFEDEAQILARLQHPGIAQVHAAGTTRVTGEERPFFAMERVRGDSLLEFANARGLDLRGRVALLVKVAEALHHAHQKGVIHRDLKPDNVLVEESGQPKIVDFGVARAIDAGASAHATEPGRLLGTLPYMSPEQVEGDPAEIDTRSDVYSLGVTAYELCTGELPYPVLGKSPLEAARVVREVRPRPAGEHGRAFRGDLATILGKALEKERERRYASASELAEDLRRFLEHQPVAARPASRSYLLRRFARRNRAFTAAIGALLVSLVAGAAATGWQALRATRQLERTRDAEREAREQLALASMERDRARGVSAYLSWLFSSVGTQGPDVKVVDALEQAVRDLDETYQGGPAVEAEVRDAVGRSFHALGELDRALPQFERVLELRRELLGSRNLETLAAMNSLALTYKLTGRLEEAEDLYREALGLQEDLLGETHAHTLATRANLGTLCYARGEREEALALFRAVLAAIPPDTDDEIERQLLDAARGGLAALGEDVEEAP